MGSDAYDAAIAAGHAQRRTTEDIFFDLALDDLGRAADALRLIHGRTAGADGFVWLEVSRRVTPS